MKKNIDEIYVNIAQNLSDILDDSWKKIILNVKLVSDVVGFNGSYEGMDNKWKNLRVSKLDDSVYDDFEELYEIMTEKSDIHKWNKAIFTLESDGSFHIDFDWDESLEDE